MNGALSHITVLDLSRILAGPWAGQVLADLGAEVIKIERPGTGDDTRSWGPPHLRDAQGNDGADAAYYLCANRNKQSVTVDFTTAEGREIVRNLARQADVVLENFKVGSLAAYGLDYESLRAVNPRLIYCSITGFGQTGPYAARAGYDLLVQAMGGLMSITGRQDDEPGAGPQKAGVAVADILTGLYAPNLVPYQDFRTSDGYVIIAVGNDAQFARLCGVLALAELASDPSFASNKQRVLNRRELIDTLSAVTVTHPTAHWVAALESVGVPAGPINNLEAVFADPQVRARGMRVEIPHPVAGTVSLVANPLRLSETPVSYRSAPPPLGAQTREVLMERLSLSAVDVEELRAKGVV